MSRINKVLLMVTILVLALSACGPSETPTPEATDIDLDAFATQVAANVIQQITQTAAAQPSNTPTPESTATPEESPTPEVTEEIPQVTVAPGDCDNAAYVADISIPDGTSINAGAEFVKTWSIRNTGSCTWNTNYKLVYAYPEGGPFVNTSASVSQEVAPDGTIEISITLKAPTTSGNYTGAWRMVNPGGYAFGEFVTAAIVVP